VADDIEWWLGSGSAPGAVNGQSANPPLGQLFPPTDFSKRQSSALRTVSFRGGPTRCSRSPSTIVTARRGFSPIGRASRAHRAH